MPRLEDVERIVCVTSAQKERRGESTPDQTETGFNILFLARAEREELESTKRSILSGTEVLTQTIANQLKSEPAVKIRTATCAPAGTPSAPHTFSSANDLSSPTGDWQPLFPDHTSTLTSLVGQPTTGLRLFLD